MRRNSCRGVSIKRPCSGFGAWHKHRYNSAFTVLELLIVISIIIVLAGLTLATMGYVQNKGGRSRAEAETAAMSAALESYKADNGVYPNTTNTNSLTAVDQVKNDPLTGTYASATLDLYEKLTGDTAHDGSSSGAKSYMQFRPQMLGRQDKSTSPSAGNKITSIIDPFGYSYGYSTSKNPDANANASTAKGYNPTFDLWSTAGDAAGNQNQWIKNW